MTTEVLQLKNIQAKLLVVLLCLLLTVFVSYVYLINSIVFDLASREALGQERTRLVLELGELEANYLQLSNALTIERAYTLGFEKTNNNVAFITVPPIIPVLALNSGYERSE